MNIYSFQVSCEGDEPIVREEAASNANQPSTGASKGDVRVIESNGNEETTLGGGEDFEN